jgi:hypothetical protein
VRGIVTHVSSNVVEVEYTDSGKLHKVFYPNTDDGLVQVYNCMGFAGQQVPLFNFNGGSVTTQEPTMGYLSSDKLKVGSRYKIAWLRTDIQDKGYSVDDKVEIAEHTNNIDLHFKVVREFKDEYTWGTRDWTAPITYIVNHSQIGLVELEANSIKCVCSSRQLLVSGCSCGAFKKEQELKKKGS